MFAILTLLALLVYNVYDSRQLKKAKLLVKGEISQIEFSNSPQQLKISADDILLNGLMLKPRALYIVRARVLSRETYSFDKLAELSPIDLALGWEKMSDPEIYNSINIWQNQRWYYYNLQKSNLLLDEVRNYSSNNHIIPANKNVERVMLSVKKGDIIKLKGMLVDLVFPNNVNFTTSLIRDDSGAGSCEIIYVTAVEIEK